MKVAEDDEEKAYSWIRFWGEDQLKAVMDLKYQKLQAAQLIDRLEHGLKSMDEAYRLLRAAVAKLEKGAVELDEDEEMALLSDDDFDTDKDSPPKLDQARSKLAEVVEKRETQREELGSAKGELKDIAVKLRQAEKEKDEVWKQNKLLMGDGRTRTQLSTEHTKNYIIRFLFYPGYYLELPQTRTTWIGDNMMAIWGGVRLFIPPSLFNAYPSIYSMSRYMREQWSVCFKYWRRFCVHRQRTTCPTAKLSSLFLTSRNGSQNAMTTHY